MLSAMIVYYQSNFVNYFQQTASFQAFLLFFLKIIPLNTIKLMHRSKRLICFNIKGFRVGTYAY